MWVNYWLMAWLMYWMFSDCGNSSLGYGYHCFRGTCCLCHGRWPWQWRQQVPLKCWYSLSALHDVTFQKTTVWTLTAVGTWKLVQTIWQNSWHFPLFSYPCIVHIYRTAESNIFLLYYFKLFVLLPKSIKCAHFQALIFCTLIVCSLIACCVYIEPVTQLLLLFVYCFHLLYI
jgi:hypothetical protein